jgi:hypothetical protein
MNGSENRNMPRSSRKSGRTNFFNLFEPCDQSLKRSCGLRIVLGSGADCGRCRPTVDLFVHGQDLVFDHPRPVRDTGWPVAAIVVAEPTEPSAEAVDRRVQIAIAQMLEQQVNRLRRELPQRALARKPDGAPPPPSPPSTFRDAEVWDDDADWTDA